MATIRGFLGRLAATERREARLQERQERREARFQDTPAFEAQRDAIGAIFANAIALRENGPEMAARNADAIVAQMYELTGDGTIAIPHGFRLEIDGNRIEIPATRRAGAEPLLGIIARGAGIDTDEYRDHIRAAVDRHREARGLAPIWNVGNEREEPRHTRRTENEHEEPLQKRQVGSEPREAQADRYATMSQTDLWRTYEQQVRENLGTAMGQLNQQLAVTADGTYTAAEQAAINRGRTQVLENTLRRIAGDAITLDGRVTDEERAAAIAAVREDARLSASLSTVLERYDAQTALAPTASRAEIVERLQLMDRQRGTRTVENSRSDHAREGDGRQQQHEAEGPDASTSRTSRAGAHIEPPPPIRVPERIDAATLQTLEQSLRQGEGRPSREQFATLGRAVTSTGGLSETDQTAALNRMSNTFSFGTRSELADIAANLRTSGVRGEETRERGESAQGETHVGAHAAQEHRPQRMALATPDVPDVRQNVDGPARMT